MLQAHPSVAQAAVVGRPDPVVGEEPVAFVIPTPGASIDEAELIAHCRDVLAHFKVPRAIYAVDTLPRNAVGKVTKDVLRRPSPRRQLAVTPVAVTTDVVARRHTLVGMAVARSSTRREPKVVHVGGRST